MKQSIYSILDGEEVLMNEKIFDERNNLIKSIDYSLKPNEEKRFQYNDQNLLIREESMLEERIGDSQEYEYDSNGNITEQRHNIGGSLYEKTTIEKLDNLEIRRTFQDEQETERIELSVEDNVKTYCIYDYDELVQVNTVVKEGNTVTTTSLVVASEQSYTEVQQFNENGDLIESSDFYGEEDQNSILKRTFIGKNCGSVRFESFTQPHTNYEEVFTFDENGNCTLYEKKDFSGRLIRFEKIRYNDLNKPVEKAGNTGSTKYHYRIDYNETIDA